MQEMHLRYRSHDLNNPTLSVSTSKTTSSITTVATASATSGISKYEFSKDNGATWVNNGTSNTYTFTGLTHNTSYNIKVRVTSGSGKQTISATTVVTTNAIQTPTYSETNNGEVVINYPSGCGSEYTCSYSKDGGAFETITNNPTVYFGTNGTLVAKVNDGTNTLTTSTYSVVRNDLYVSNSGNDTTGYGTINKPYATIQKAYDSANSKADINIMTDVAVTDSITLDKNKNITIESYSNTNKINSITRDPNFTDSVILSIISDTVNLKNITIDGNNIQAKQGLIWLLNAHMTMDSNTTLKNSISTEINGGVVQTGGTSTFEVNGGQMINNKAPSSGAIHNSPGCEVIINGGTLSNNQATNGSGGAISNYGNLIINNATISNNKVIYDGGAILNACWENSCGTMEMINGLIETNTAQNGGAIAIHGTEASASSAVIKGGSLSNNKASIGGGAIYINGDISINPTLEISGTTLIDSNVSTNGGGILVSNAKLTMSGGTFSNNIANESSGEGGAIAFHNTSIGIIKSGTITKNKGWHGFGIMINGKSVVTMTGGTISENTGSSGAVGLYSNANFILEGGTIKNNTASVADGGIARWTGGGEPTYTYKSGTVSGNKPANSYETG